VDIAQQQQQPPPPHNALLGGSLRGSTFGSNLSPFKNGSAGLGPLASHGSRGSPGNGVGSSGSGRGNGGSGGSGPSEPLRGDEVLLAVLPIASQGRPLLVRLYAPQQPRLAMSSSNGASAAGPAAAGGGGGTNAMARVSVSDRLSTFPCWGNLWIPLCAIKGLAKQQARLSSSQPNTLAEEQGQLQGHNQQQHHQLPFQQQQPPLGYTGEEGSVDSMPAHPAPLNGLNNSLERRPLGEPLSGSSAALPSLQSPFSPPLGQSSSSSLSPVLPFGHGSPLAPLGAMPSQQLQQQHPLAAAAAAAAAGGPSPLSTLAPLGAANTERAAAAAAASSPSTAFGAAAYPTPAARYQKRLLPAGANTAAAGAAAGAPGDDSGSGSYGASLALEFLAPRLKVRFPEAVKAGEARLSGENNSSADDTGGDADAENGDDQNMSAGANGTLRLSPSKELADAVASAVRRAGQRLWRACSKGDKVAPKLRQLLAAEAPPVDFLKPLPPAEQYYWSLPQAARAAADDKCGSSSDDDKPQLPPPSSLSSPLVTCLARASALNHLAVCDALLAFGADPNALVVEAPPSRLRVPATNDSSQASSSGQGSPGSQPSRHSVENSGGGGGGGDFIISSSSQGGNAWIYVFAAGRTPLMVAATLGHSSVCALLVRGGARVDAVDNEGLTALDLAQRVIGAGTSAQEDSSISSSSSSTRQRSETIALLEGVLTFGAADSGGSAGRASAALTGNAGKTEASALALTSSVSDSLANAVDMDATATSSSSNIARSAVDATEVANGEASSEEQTAGGGEAGEDAEDGLRRFLEATLSGNSLQLMGNAGDASSRSSGLGGSGLGNGASCASEAAPSPFQSDDDEEDDDDVEFNSEAFGYPGTASNNSSDGKLDVSTLFGGALIFTGTAGNLDDEHGESNGLGLGCDGSPTIGRSPRQAVVDGGGGGNEKGGGLDAAGLMAAFDLAAEGGGDGGNEEAAAGCNGDDVDTANEGDAAGGDYDLLGAGGNGGVDEVREMWN